MVWSLYVQRNRSSALLFIFFQNNRFWGVGRKWRTKQQYAGWSRIWVLNSSWPFFFIPGGFKKSAKLIMSKQTDQALYSSFFSKTIFWGILTGWEKMKGKTTICWLVENIGSKFFPTVFWSPGGFQQVCEANPLSKIVCSLFVERNRSSALLFIFLKNHVFWDFGGLGENEWQNNDILAGPEFWF